MKELEANVRGIEKDGLVWGASKFVAVGFGIKKLQINLVIEDEKISLDELQEQIAEDEDHVQSTDIVRDQTSDISDFTNGACFRPPCKSCRLLLCKHTSFSSYTFIMTRCPLSRIHSLLQC